MRRLGSRFAGNTLPAGQNLIPVGLLAQDVVKVSLVIDTCFGRAAASHSPWQSGVTVSAEVPKNDA